MSNLKQKKHQLRAMMRDRLSELKPNELAAQSRAICETAAQHLTEIGCGTGKIAIFAQHGNEVSLETLHQLLPSAMLCYPRCEKGKKLCFYHVPDPTQLRPRTLGIREPEPDANTEIPLGEIDNFLCPGLAFTLSGSRLGHGGGYYDRLLSKRNASAQAIGVALSCQLLDFVPTTEHDVSLDAIITRDGYHNCATISS